LWGICFPEALPCTRQNQAVFDAGALFGIILKWFGVSNMTEMLKMI
jgi:hypothetical protein